LKFEPGWPKSLNIDLSRTDCVYWPSDIDISGAPPLGRTGLYHEDEAIVNAEQDITNGVEGDPSQPSTYMSHDWGFPGKNHHTINKWDD
jgi:hypothetical protein